jgi:hypothetical protein
MATSYPKTIPHPWQGDDLLTDAYRRGWNHGHGFACHNVPNLGAKLWTDSLGRVTVDAENIREVHESLCYAAESGSRDYSPFEFTAHEFNDSEHSEDLWEAFESGTSDAIQADLAEYSDEDYGIRRRCRVRSG